MNIGELTFIAVVVVATTGALKDAFPTMTGNATRLVAIVVGGVLGLLAQTGWLPGIDANFVTGALAGVAAIGTVTVADRI